MRCWTLLALLWASCAAPDLTPLQPVDPRVTAALDYLGREMDAFHAASVVYDDVESGGACFYPSGWMGKPDPWIDDRLTVADVTSTRNSGNTSLRISWKPATRNAWAGIYWLYPQSSSEVERGSDELDWKEYPGRDLSGATKLTFWARGEWGGEIAEFKFGGIRAQVSVLGPVVLEREWRRYEIPITGGDLTRVVGGFCWVTNALQNPRGCTIYVDDVVIDCDRREEPRLIRSYHVGMRTLERDTEHLRNTCFVYDNAVAVCAFLSTGRQHHRRRALLIADALLELIELEGDGSLCSAYSCGDLAGNEWRDESFEVAPRYPWRVNPAGEPPILQDTYSLRKDTGNMAWAALALLHCWRATDDLRYREGAQSLAQWILGNAESGGSGYAGGRELGVPGTEYKRIQWQSTEHNIDLVAIFRQLAADETLILSRREQYARAAESCEQFLGWAATRSTDYLVTGTIEASGSPRLEPIPLDPQTWSVLLSPGEERYERALRFALKHLTWRDGSFPRARYSIAEASASPSAISGMWPEGMAQVALALQTMGEPHEAWLESIESVIDATAGPHARDGVVAAHPESFVTDFDWSYLNLPHVGATAWYVLAKQGWNPFAEH